MAQYNLGVCYANGEGVPKDDGIAVSWYRKAAVQGNAMAEYNLGVCYANGKGVPKDDVLAYMWYNLAAVQDSDAAKNRENLTKSMTSEPIAEAQHMSREWKPTQANK